jgi:hypothetical protein
MPEPTSSGGGNVTRSTYLEFYDAYAAADALVAEAVGARKDLRARIKGAGFLLGPFDRARKEAEKSGDMREAEDAEFRRNMEWLGKPVGFQTTIFTEAEAPAGGAPNGHDTAAVSEHQRRRVSDAGHTAGLHGYVRDGNPWSPGTLLYQVWDSGWHQGAEMLAQSRVPEPGSKRPRGRPPGSRNRPKGGQPHVA